MKTPIFNGRSKNNDAQVRVYSLRCDSVQMLGRSSQMIRPNPFNSILIQIESIAAGGLNDSHRIRRLRSMNKHASRNNKHLI